MAKQMISQLKKEGHTGQKEINQEELGHKKECKRRQSGKQNYRKGDGLQEKTDGADD